MAIEVTKHTMLGLCEFKLLARSTTSPSCYLYLFFHGASIDDQGIENTLVVGWGRVETSD